MDNCPKCNISLIGGEIPKEIAHYYTDTYWRRETGIDGGMMGLYDGIVAFRCPDCGHEWPRDKSEWAKGLFLSYLEIKMRSSLSRIENLIKEKP